MKTIKILKSRHCHDAMPMLMELSSVYWLEILKMDNGTLEENDNSIELKTTNNKVIIGDKNKIHYKDSYGITYKANLNSIGDYDCLLTKFADEKTFELKEDDELGFIVSFEIV